MSSLGASTGAAVFNSSLTDGVQLLQFGRAVICTGARPAIPDIPGLLETPFMTTETIFNLTEMPVAMIVIGGGVFGCEIGQSFSIFGCKVTLLARSSLLRGKEEHGEDPAAVEVIDRCIQEDGVVVEEYVEFKKVSHDGNEFTVSAVRRRDGSKFTLKAPALLVSTGRAPNVSSLNLEAAGVKYDCQRGIYVTDALQSTSCSNIYAAGDCSSSKKFVHTGSAMAKIVVRNALFGLGKNKANRLIVPLVVFTDPEYAIVGEWEAPNATEYRYNLKDNDRAVLEGDSDRNGFVKILADSNGKILGATIVATRAGDMIAEISLAMRHKLTITDIATTIHAYPTVQTAVMLAAQKFQESRVTPTAKFLYRKLVTMKAKGRVKEATKKK